VRIDSCTYFGSWPLWEVKTRTKADYIALLDKCEIDRALVLSTRSIFYDARQGNEELAELMQAHPDRVAGIATVDPRSGQAATEELKRRADQGMRGIALYPLYHQYYLDDGPALDPILAQAIDLGLPILISTRIITNWSLPTLDGRLAESLCKRYPEGRFLLTGLNRERGSLSSLARCPNLSFETSCMQGGFAIESYVAQFGVERMLYGSGLPLQYPACGLAKVEGAEIKEEERERILWRNAAELFAL
jgi:predicted TIM-barrel fold metal-dependent hydrolase